MISRAKSPITVPGYNLTGGLLFAGVNGQPRGAFNADQKRLAAARSDWRTKFFGQETAGIPRRASVAITCRPTSSAARSDSRA